MSTAHRLQTEHRLATHGFGAGLHGVNLPVRQFSDEHLLNAIAAILRDTGMAPQLLKLKISEGMAIHHPDHALTLLTAIKQMGMCRAIDDFGAGYSSRGKLKHFPIDTIKVDRSFICDIPGNPQDKAITQVVIVIGKTLDLTVVAEDVETQEQENFLHEHAWDAMQGCYFSRTVGADEIAALSHAQATRVDENQDGGWTGRLALSIRVPHQALSISPRFVWKSCSSIRF